MATKHLEISIFDDLLLFGTDMSKIKTDEELFTTVAIALDAAQIEHENIPTLSAIVNSVCTMRDVSLMIACVLMLLPSSKNLIGCVRERCAAFITTVLPVLCDKFVAGQLSPCEFTCACRIAWITFRRQKKDTKGGGS